MSRGNNSDRFTSYFGLNASSYYQVSVDYSFEAESGLLKLDLNGLERFYGGLSLHLSTSLDHANFTGDSTSSFDMRYLNGNNNTVGSVVVASDNSTRFEILVASPTNVTVNSTNSSSIALDQLSSKTSVFFQVLAASNANSSSSTLRDFRESVTAPPQVFLAKDSILEGMPDVSSGLDTLAFFFDLSGINAKTVFSPFPMAQNQLNFTLEKQMLSAAGGPHLTQVNRTPPPPGLSPAALENLGLVVSPADPVSPRSRPPR